MKFQPIIKTLEEKKQKNNQQLELELEKKFLAKENQFEHQAVRLLINSLAAYGFIFIPLLFLLTSGGANPLANIVSAEFYPMIVVGSSLSLGGLMKFAQDKRLHLKERIKSFSKAQTETEKIVEEVQYQIASAKSTLQIYAIDKTLEELEKQENILEEVSSKYNLSPKKTTGEVEKIQRNIENLEVLIQDRQDKIDLLGTKLVLYTRFWNIACKSMRISDLLFKPFFGMFFAMFSANVPLLIMRDTITYSSELASLVTTLAPAVLGFLGTSGYLLKRNHDYKLAFNHLNDQLGAEALPKINDKSYSQQIGKEKEEEIIKSIYEQTSGIKIATIKLQEELELLACCLSEKENVECPIKSPDEMMSENKILPLTFEETPTKNGPVLVRKIKHGKDRGQN